MFKPENIYFIQGHGETNETFDIVSTPFGKIVLQYDRFEVPNNVFTASSREIGLNTPPDTYATLNLLENANKLPIPSSDTYSTYTNGLRVLGKDLFTILVETAQQAKYSWNFMQSQYTTKMIPKIIHTHAHMHSGFNSLSRKEQERDLFLYSAPNDTLKLGTRAVVLNSQTIEETPGLRFSDSHGYFPSGIIPLDELAMRNPDHLNIFRLLVPRKYDIDPMNLWTTLGSQLTPEEKAEWKRLVTTKIVPTPEMRELFSLGEDEFCEKLTAYYLQLLTDCYFWTPTDEKKEDFLKKTLVELQFSMNSKTVLNTILEHRRKTGKPDEPILLLFYHCRVLGDKGNVYAAIPPSISRSLSFAAATGEPLDISLPSNAYSKFQESYKNHKNAIKSISEKEKYQRILTLARNKRTKVNIKTKIPFTPEQLTAIQKEYNTLVKERKEEYNTLQPQKDALKNLYAALTAENRGYIRNFNQHKYAEKGGKQKTRKATTKTKAKKRRLTRRL